MGRAVCETHQTQVPMVMGFAKKSSTHPSDPFLGIYRLIQTPMSTSRIRSAECRITAMHIPPVNIAPPGF
jgi:hypothetical protein